LRRKRSQILDPALLGPFNECGDVTDRNAPSLILRALDRLELAVPSSYVISTNEGASA
jgi:hypothetical protein